MVKYIEPEELARKIREGNEEILIIDVRDHDFEVGKIKGSINVPYCDFHRALPELLRVSREFEMIIFHCHFSAQRGPSVENSGAQVLQVLVLRGGYKNWRKLYQSEEDLYEAIS